MINRLNKRMNDDTLQTRIVRINGKDIEVSSRVLPSYLKEREEKHRTEVIERIMKLNWLRTEALERRSRLVLTPEDVVMLQGMKIST